MFGDNFRKRIPRWIPSRNSCGACKSAQEQMNQMSQIEAYQSLEALTEHVLRRSDESLVGILSYELRRKEIRKRLEAAYRETYEADENN